MDTKDLMLGDWVFYRNNPYYVQAIESNGMVRIIPSDMADVLSRTTWPDKITPIPLTPEILEKNGFYYEKTYDVWILEYGKIIIEVGIFHPDFIIISYREITPDYTTECNISSICKVDGSDIMTHELQHALRLCGIEKEIMI